MKRTASDFIESFVLPLVAGGDLNVGKPISEPELRIFCRQLPHASVAADKVDDARADVVAELVVRPPALILDEDELFLAAAVHNLLYLSHPDSDVWTVTRGMERRVLDTASAFAKRALTTNRRKVLARHSLLHNVFDITRTDLTIKWWTGRATFYGQEPPKRLVAWRSLRRVSEDRSTADFSQLFGTEVVAPVIHSLVRRTPLTILLNPLQMGASLSWEETVFLLREAELARAISYRAIQADNPSSVVSAPAAFASAFEQLLERNPSEDDVRAVAAFLVHLNALLAMSEADARDPKRSALLNVVLAPDRAASRPRGLTTFFALPAALAQVDPRVAEPPGLDSDRRVAARWQQHRAQVTQDVGEAVIDTLASRLARHLTVEPPAAKRAVQ